MRTLGVVLARGQSRRFGSDKAAALLGGCPLLNHALQALRPHCDSVAIAGRGSMLALALPDWPTPGMGPLGGLAAGLRYACDHGFDQLLSLPVDCAHLPANLRRLLDPAPSFIAAQPVIGLWPAGAAAAIEANLRGAGGHTVRAFAEAIGARAVTGTVMPDNINTPQDLARVAKQRDRICQG
ncbi:molybdenum cofactor guanylyltransferase [Sphingomonas sp. M1-B02]|uniref:molybdenum cofactor guanylyltransferase n=1 Tax=Sphingomonas sp. M1-B02 TaxID=3114300 RepID=UPI002240D819|nr:molybdenum cofactor guanylyltransferase [Sphingomonas sp. S6-11]UZK67275.1 molybdenum cofactor guanylyltransferase [Sphingomonas sp. S6-11]